MSSKYDNLVVLCNGCGKPMRSMGQWPVTYPLSENGSQNTQLCTRYTCATCKIPHPTYAPGVPALISILEPDMAA